MLHVIVIRDEDICCRMLLLMLLFTRPIEVVSITFCVVGCLFQSLVVVLLVVTVYLTVDNGKAFLGI
jgi:hypothetical protein